MSESKMTEKQLLADAAFGTFVLIEAAQQGSLVALGALRLVNQVYERQLKKPFPFAEPTKLDNDALKRLATAAARKTKKGRS